jgi:hypothetical protein
MEKAKVSRTWGIAAVILALVLGVTGLFIWTTSPARAQAGAASCPAIMIQWRAGSVLESMFAARVVEDNLAIKEFLQTLARGTELTVAARDKLIGRTYLKNPRLQTRAGRFESWEEVLPVLRKIVAGSGSISINTVSILIDYQTFIGGADPDIDAIAHIRMSFSASPGDNYFEGTLKHSRVCQIDP